MASITTRQLTGTGVTISPTPLSNVQIDQNFINLNDELAQKLPLTGGTLTGALTVGGNLTVNGTTFTINSTTVTVDDPIFSLGGDTVPVTDDNKDRGIEFRWHNGSVAKLGFFGFDDSTGKFTFVPDATNTSEVFSGTKGTIDANIEWADVLSKPNYVASVATTAPLSGGAAGSVGGALTLSLAAGYGDTQNPYASKTTSTFLAAPSVGNGAPSFRTIVASDIPTLNQSTTGNAATATTLATARNINGVSFNGSADITIAANTSNSLTFNNGGSGSVSGSTFNGSSAVTVSYNTIGAAAYINQAGTGYNFNTATPSTPTLYRVIWNTGDTSMTNSAAGNTTGLLIASQGSHSLWNAQLFAKQGSEPDLYIRGSSDAGGAISWGTWRTVLHSSNYNTYSPTLTGTGASGTWSISVTGSAGSIANNNIVDYLRITNVGGAQRLLMGNQDSSGVNNPSMIVAANGSIELGNGNTWTTNGGTFTKYVTFNSSFANFTTPLQQNSNQVVHAGNVSTYALPIGGGTLTGNLSLNGRLNLPQNPVGTTYGSGVSLVPTYYIGQVSGDDDAWKIYGESDSTNKVRLVFETNDDNDVNESFLFRQKKTYGDYSVNNLLAFDTNGITFKGNTILHAGNYNSYSPTLIGTGASGTWSINITGIAGSSTTAAKTSATTVPASTAFSKWLFATTSTSGTLDWNDSSNTIPGTGSTLLLGNATNGPGGGNYYHPFNIEYAGIDGVGNVTQMAVAYGTPANELYMRGRYGGSWTSWTRFLNSANYNSYSPTLTGTGASGTWGINITGNAATVTNGVYTTSNVMLLRSGITDSTYNSATTTGLYTVSYTGYSRSLMVWNTGGSTGIVQLDVNYGDQGEIRLRNATDSVTWSNWRTFLTSYNYNNYSPTLTGGGASGTWGINITGNAATATTADQIDSWVFRNTGSNSAVNADTLESNGITYYTSGVTNFSGNASDGALYSQFYSSSWQHQIAGDYRSGQIALRGKNNGTWQAWRTVLDSGNYNSYSPTLTGSGASGTWGINVTGYSTSVNLGNSSSTQLLGSAWAGTSGYPGYQFSGGNSRFGFSSTSGVIDVYTDGNYYANEGTSLVLHSGNYNSYSPTLTGGGASGTWSISVTGNAATASSVAWTNVSGRPSTIAGLLGTDSVDANPSGRLGSGYYQQSSTTTANGWPLTSGWWHLHSVTHSNTANYYAMQLAADFYANNLYYRSTNGSGTTGWSRVILDTNYNSYSPTLTGGNASGTWGINVTGTAGGVAWGNISSKPSRIMFYEGFTLDANTMSSNATGFTYSVNAPYTGPVARFSTDGSYDLWLNAPYSGGNALAFRTRNGDNATLNSWKYVLHDGNYNSYSPTLTGGNASGTWSINITGTASSISGFNNPTTAATGNTIVYRDGSGHITGNYIFANYFNAGSGNSENPTIGQVWTQSTGDNYLRKSTPAHFISQLGLITTSNYSSYALPLSGGTVTGATYFQSNLGATSGGLSSPPLQAYSTGNNSAFMSFHKGGHYAINMGLDSDNVFRIGGWSASANLLQMDMSGNLTMAGNVTAYSDERLKKDWSDLSTDFVAKLAQVRAGTYTRTDENIRQVGVSAQSLQPLLPEAVQDDGNYLSVAYGNAALASAVELAKDNLRLRARIERLEALVEQLLVKE